MLDKILKNLWLSQLKILNIYPFIMNLRKIPERPKSIHNWQKKKKKSQELFMVGSGVRDKLLQTSKCIIKNSLSKHWVLDYK